PHALLPLAHVAVLGLAIHEREEHGAGDLRLDLCIAESGLRDEHALHFLEPAPERLEVAPFEDEAVDDRAPGERGAVEILPGTEALVGELEMRARLARGERQAADAVPVRKPWVGGASVGGETREPAFHHRPAALLEQRARVP